MNVIPYTRGTEILKISKRDLTRYIRKNCVEDLPLVSMNTGSGENIKYGTEIYDDYIMIWNVPNGSLGNFIFTTLHLKLKTRPEGISINWHIRFNIWANLLTLAAIGLSLTQFFLVIFEDSKMDLITLLTIAIPYPMFIAIYNSDANENKEFIKELKITFTNIELR